MKTETIGSFEAKTHFAAILEKAQQGTVFVVTKRGHPVAELRPTIRSSDRLSGHGGKDDDLYGGTSISNVTR